MLRTASFIEDINATEVFTIIIPTSSVTLHFVVRVFLTAFVFFLSVDAFQCAPSTFLTNVHIRSVISYIGSCVLRTETIFAS